MSTKMKRSTNEKLKREESTAGHSNFEINLAKKIKRESKIFRTVEDCLPTSSSSVNGLAENEIGHGSDECVNNQVHRVEGSKKKKKLYHRSHTSNEVFSEHVPLDNVSSQFCLGNNVLPIECTEDSCPDDGAELNIVDSGVVRLNKGQIIVGSPAETSKKHKKKKTNKDRHESDLEESIIKKRRKQHNESQLSPISVKQRNQAALGALTNEDSSTTPESSSIVDVGLCSYPLISDAPGHEDVGGTSLTSLGSDVPGHEEEDFSSPAKHLAKKARIESSTIASYPFSKLSKTSKKQGIAADLNESKLQSLPVSHSSLQKFISAEDESFINSDITEAADLVHYIRGEEKHDSTDYLSKGETLKKKKKKKPNLSEELNNVNSVHGAIDVTTESSSKKKKKKKKKKKSEGFESLTNEEAQVCVVTQEPSADKLYSLQQSKSNLIISKTSLKEDSFQDQFTPSSVRMQDSKLSPLYVKEQVLASPSYENSVKNNEGLSKSKQKKRIKFVEERSSKEHLNPESPSSNNLLCYDAPEKISTKGTKSGGKKEKERKSIELKVNHKQFLDMKTSSSLKSSVNDESSVKQNIIKEKKLKVDVVQDSSQTETIKDKESSEDKTEASPWHRLSRDSNGSFTCQNHYHPTVASLSAKKRVRFEQIHNSSFDVDSQSVKNPSENEPGTTEAGESTKTVPDSQVNTDESSGESSDFEPLVSGRGNLKGLTQRPVKSRTMSVPRETAPTQIVGEVIIKSPSMGRSNQITSYFAKETNIESSELSECEGNTIPGRGNLKGLTQKLPLKINVSKTTKNKDVSKFSSSSSGLHQKSTEVEVVQEQSVSEESSSETSSSSADNFIEPASGESSTKSKTGAEERFNGKPSIKANGGKSLKTTLGDRVASRNSSSSSDEDDDNDFVNKSSKDKQDGIKKKHRCTRCLKWFKTASEMMRHDCRLVRKTKESPKKLGAAFKCDQCDRKYVQKCHLNHHVRTSHQGYRPYTCETCDMSFSEKQTLVVHMRIHTKSKPYECTFCKAEFVTTTHLHRHYRTFHNLLQSYHCDFCDSSYFFPKDLEVHVSSVHKRKVFHTLKTLDGNPCDSSLLK